MNAILCRPLRLLDEKFSHEFPQTFPILTTEEYATQECHIIRYEKLAASLITCLR